MDTELDDFIEWLRVLQLPEEDFKRHVRPYFDNTTAMEKYIEDRKPQAGWSEYSPDEYFHRDVPTMPYHDQETVSEPRKSGRYKGKRRKR